MERIGTAELVLAESGIKQLLADPSYTDTGIEILSGIYHPKLKEDLLGQNIAQAQTTALVVRYLKEKTLVDPEAADKTLAILQQKTDDAKQRGIELRKVPIEQVAKFAKAELERYIELEKNSEVELKERFNSLSTLEQAIYNLEILDGWVSEGTWLKEALSRTKRYEIISRSFLSLYYPFGPEFIYAAYGVSKDFITVTIEKLEEWWDKGDKSLVQKIANLNRVKFAKKLIKLLKTS